MSRQNISTRGTVRVQSLALSTFSQASQNAGACFTGAYRSRIPACCGCRLLGEAPSARALALGALVRSVGMVCLLLGWEREL